MLRSKWHRLLSNLVLFYLDNVIDTGQKFGRAVAVCNKCENTLQAMRASWLASVWISLVSFCFSLSSPDCPCCTSGNGKLCIRLIYKVHKFSCLNQMNLSVYNRNRAMPQRSVSIFPTSKINLLSVYAQYSNTCKSMHSKVSERQLFRVLCAHHLHKPAMGLGANPAATNSRFPSKILSSWLSNYREEKEFISRGQQWCAHVGYC